MKPFLQRYKSYGFAMIAVLLFVVTVLVLHAQGFIQPATIISDPEINPTPNPVVPTEIKINNTPINGKMIYISHTRLEAYDPTTQTTEILSDALPLASQYLGMLRDGRLFFWHKPTDQDINVFTELYVQHGSQFDRYTIPLQAADGFMLGQMPPQLSQDGSYVLFTSDRDSVANLKRHALYSYDLSTFELKKLTDDKRYTVLNAMISPNDQLIAFAYQSSELNQGSADSALGVLVRGSETPNLFPKYRLQDIEHFEFSADSQVIIYNGLEGVQAFSLKKGSPIDSLAGYQYRARNQTDLTLMESAPSSKSPTWLQTCSKPENPEVLTKLPEKVVFFQLSDKGFEEKIELKDTKTAFQAASALDAQGEYLFANDQNEQVVVEQYSAEDCQGGLVILNLTTQAMNPLPFSTQQSVIWVP